MKSFFKLFLILFLIGIVAYSYLWFHNSYLGWYGYEQWKYRHGTISIEEAKARGVFVKQLNYKVENYVGDLHNFQPYIEKGFTYGKHSSKVTVPIKTTYPYEISFQYRRNENFGVLIKDEDLKKFDSSGSVWGYMKKPELPDTISLQIGGEGISHDAKIKVWD